MLVRRARWLRFFSMDPGISDPEGAAGNPEADLAARLLAIESLLGEGDPAAVAGVLSSLAALEDELSRAPLVESPHRDSLRIGVLTARGHAARLGQDPAEAVASYDAALLVLSAVGEDDRRRANLWTCRGLALLAGGDSASLGEARRSFDESIRLRLAEAPLSRTHRWGLAAAFLNRADALAGIGGREGLVEALRSCEEARGALEGFDPAENPSVRTRWALSWMKQGDAAARLQRDCGEDRAEECLACYVEATAVLRAGAEEGFEESRRVLAVALGNLSRHRLAFDGKGSAEGIGEARESLRWLGEAETSSPETLALGGTVRVVLAGHLETWDEGGDRSLEITDLVEEGLARAGRARRAFPKDGLDEAIVGELARVGAEAYLRAAPQFLSEFLLDLLDPNCGEGHFADLAAVHEAAVRTLWKGIAAIQAEGFTGMGGPDYETRRGLLVEWERCREELARIRRAYFEIA